MMSHGPSNVPEGLSIPLHGPIQLLKAAAGDVIWAAPGGAADIFMPQAWVSPA